MRRNLVALATLAAAAMTAGCGWHSAASGKAVPAVTETVFRSVYEEPVYYSLYGGEGDQALRPADPLRGTGQAIPRPPLREE